MAAGRILFATRFQRVGGGYSLQRKRILYWNWNLPLANDYGVFREISIQCEHYNIVSVHMNICDERRRHLCSLYIEAEIWKQMGRNGGAKKLLVPIVFPTTDELNEAAGNMVFGRVKLLISTERP